MMTQFETDARRHELNYEQQARKLARMFQENFAKYADVADDKIAAAGPKG